MNRFDAAFQPGSPFLLWLGGLLTGFFVALAILAPEHRYFALFLVLLGLSGTWRHYRQMQRQHGQDLLDPAA